LLRPIRLFLTGLVLFAAAVGVGVLVASHWGPERTRSVLEMALSDELGRPVAVEQAQLYFGGGPLAWMRGVLLDAEGIASHSKGPTGEPELAVDRLQAEIDPISLLSGRVKVRSVTLDGIHAWVGPTAAGSATSGKLSISSPPADAEPLVGWLDALAAAADDLLAAASPGHDLSFSRAELTIQGATPADGQPPWTMALHDVSGQARLRASGRQAHVSLAGRLDDGADHADIRIDLDRGPRGALRIAVDVNDLALAYAGPALKALLPTARLSGRSNLTLRAERPQEDVWQVSVGVEARDLQGTLPRLGDGHPVPIELAKGAGGLEFDLDPERLHLTRAFVSAEGSVVELTGEIERPLRMASNTVGRLSVDRYDLSRREDLIAFLPPGQIQTIQSALLPLQAGRVEDVRIEGHATLHEWLRGFDDRSGGLVPETMTARARFAGFALRNGDGAGQAVSDLSGRLKWSGDRLELRQVRGRRAGRWLPMLDATLSGLSNLAANDDVPEVPDSGKAPVLLGLDPLYRIVVDPNKPRGEMPKALMLELDHVTHPTLIWPLRNLFARVHPDEDGIRVLLEHAVWGCVPVRAEGIWTMQADGSRRVERVAVNIEVKPPLTGLEPIDPSDPVWASGRWHLDTHNLGDWHVVSSAGSFEARGEDVHLTSYDLDLGKAGHAIGNAVVEFSDGEELPYRAHVRIADAQAEGLVDKIGFEPEQATGTVTLDGHLHGELRPGRRVMAGMEGTLLVHAREGAIIRRLPVLLALAKATDTLNPFGSRDQMQYSKIDAALRFERGRVHADELRITGRDLRMQATGQVDAVDPDHPVEAVVGVFFFKALDRVIGVVPVLSNLLLGDDQNLVGAYVQLTGPWKQPQAGLVPLKTVASGPASFAIEGVPRFVRRAISAIQSAFSRPGVSAPPPRGKDS